MVTNRLPPHDSEAEQAVLGALLLDEDAITKVTSVLRPADFFLERHRWTYEACLAVYDRREPINFVTLAHELAITDRLETVGGNAFLAHLSNTTASSVFVDHYAGIVRSCAMKRGLINAAGQIAALGYEGGPDADAVLDAAEDVLSKLRSGRSTRGFAVLREGIDRYLDTPDLDGPARIYTGLSRLDKVLGGLRPSNLVILAARPGLGKTSLALGAAHHAAMKQGATVAVFSLEMGEDEVIERLLSAESSIDVQRLSLSRTGEQLGGDEERRLIEAVATLSELPLYIDDSVSITVPEMRSKARRLKQERGLDLVIVDYLQLIGGGQGNDSNRAQQVSEISRSLKAMAKELRCPVLALSQLSRAVESRKPHIPQLSDLRESGSLEQDADVVLFIHREDAYITEEEWERRYPTRKYPKGVANLMIAKHRSGPTGQVDLYFEAKTTRFFTLAADPSFAAVE